VRIQENDHKPLHSPGGLMDQLSEALRSARDAKRLLITPVLETRRQRSFGEPTLVPEPVRTDAGDPSVRIFTAGEHAMRLTHQALVKDARASTLLRRTQHRIPGLAQREPRLDHIVRPAAPISTRVEPAA
jgi:hypothetical protein